MITPKLESGCQDFAIRTAFHNWLMKEQDSYEIEEAIIDPFELQKSEDLLIVSLEIGFQLISNYRKTEFKQDQTNDLFKKFDDFIN